METVRGLEEQLIRRDNGKAYSVDTWVCPSCGKKDDYMENETTCHSCKKTLEKRIKKDKTINRKQVKDILDQKIAWKCPECKKVYDEPQICCNAEFKIPHGKSYQGFMCLGCNTIYEKELKCCSGSMMIRGDVYPEMSFDEFQKIRTGLSKPLTGVMQ